MKVRATDCNDHLGVTHQGPSFYCPSCDQQQNVRDTDDQTSLLTMILAFGSSSRTALTKTTLNPKVKVNKYYAMHAIE